MSLFSRINGGRGGGNNSNNNSGNKPVCKFYLEGRCRYGSNCNYEHPPREGNTSISNRSQQLPFHLNADAIKSDLTSGEERPSWPLSSYGPGRDAPRQLLEGAIEQSQEEFRMQYYLAKASGSTQQYEQTEREALNTANQQAQQILNDVEGAIKFVIDGKDQHPNREDMVQKASAPFNWSERPSLNQNAASTGPSTFGQPSMFGTGSTFGRSSTTGAQQGSTFGQSSTFGSGSAFGNRPQTAGSAFGQASSLGSQVSTFGSQSQSSSFGAPSALGSGASAFGRPSGLGGGAGPGFGQPSALGGSSPFGGGQAAANTQGSAFGQPSAPGGGSDFGASSPFGAGATSGGSTFGQSGPFGASSSQPAAGGSAFGQPSTPGQQTQSTFGQSAASGQQQSAFGQSSAPGQQQSTFGRPSPFAAAASGTSTFGQPSQPSQQSTFRSTSPFGASTNGSSFGKPSASSQQPPPFAAAQASTPFGGEASIASTFGQPSQTPAPSASSPAAAARPPGQLLTSWKGRPVMNENRVYFYQNNAGKKERIWFPDGPPGPNPDVEAAPTTVYDDQAIADVLKRVYDYVKENGTFKDGLIPEIPPKRDWVTWDL